MYGTLLTTDLLQSRIQYANMSVSDFGEKNLADGVQRMLDAHNAQVTQITGDLAMWTTERLMVYGAGDYTSMIEVSEVGTAPPQKTTVGSVVGFPLRSYEGAWQGSRQYFANATVGQILVNTVAMQDADRRNIVRQAVTALYRPTDYTFTDFLVDNLTNTPLPVRALVNADGLPIPPGPNGEYFNPNTHTHYMTTANATPTVSDITNLKTNVLEHYATGDACFVIPMGLESAFRAATPNFVALLATGLIGSIQNTQDPTQKLDTVSINNRLIGEFDGIPVYVRPWAPAGYMLMYLKGPNKVLGIRTGLMAGAGDLQLAFNDENYPLRASTYARQFGVGVWERTGAAIMQVNQPAVYTAPTLNI